MNSVFNLLVPSYESLVFGAKWGSALNGVPTLLTYSFPAPDAAWDYAGAYTEPGEPNQGFAPLPVGASRLAVAQALAQWSSVSGLAFAQVEDSVGAGGDIRVGWTSWHMSAYQLGAAFLPNPSASAGDVWLNALLQDTALANLQPGTLGGFTLLHELGHALGLKHPNETSAYAGSSLSVLEDSVFNTVMSGYVWPGIVASITGNIDRYPSTPMSLDIDAMQFLYGANASSHTGDDVYRFESGGKYLQTLLDAGGNDTIELTGDLPGEIDLRPGQWSQLGLAVQINGGQIQNADTVQIYKTTQIENASGGEGADRLIGNDGMNRLMGRGGNDVLAGGAGADWLSGGAGADRFVLDISAADTIEDFQVLDGDLLDLGSLLGQLKAYVPGSNPFDAGYFSLVQNDSDAWLLVDLDSNAQGAAAQPIARLLNIQASALTSTSFVQAFSPNTATDGPAGFVITGFLAIGTASNDVLEGGSKNDQIQGRDGDDQLYGLDGDDLLEGGNGNDELFGGNGSDTARFPGLSTDYTISSSATSTIVTKNVGGEVDVLRSVELLEFSNVTITITPGVGSTFTGTSASEGFGGTEFDDRMFGLGGNDTLSGFGGDDYIDGGTGADAMTGGTGNDTYVVDNAGDVVAELAGIGGGSADKVITQFEAYVLAGQIEYLTLGDGITAATGNGLNNVIVGNGGANRLDGGVGADRMEGGRGADIYYVDNLGDLAIESDNIAALQLAGPTLELDLGNTIDKVISSVSFTLGRFVEQLEISNAGGNLNGTGNELDNLLTGNAGNNEMYGLAGNDVINGMAGADSLFGGSGNDTLDGGGDVDWAVFSEARAAYSITRDDATGIYTVVSANEGTDTISNVELFRFADSLVDPTTLLDRTAPSVVSFSPASGALGVKVSSDIVLTFDEPIQRGSGVVVLRNATNAVVETFEAATSANMTVTGSTWSLNPTADLAAGATFTIALVAGMVKDASGNAYAGNATYGFTTNAPQSPPTGAVSVAGDATQGQLLSANTTLLADVNGLGAFNFQWLRNGVAIGGANASTYRLAQADVSTSVNVRVSYVDGGGAAEAVTSPGSSGVANINDAPVGGVTVFGSSSQGATLTANVTGLSDLDGLGIFTFQWLRAGSAIAGATSSAYVLTQADVGALVSLRASYVDGFGASESVLSNAVLGQNDTAAPLAATFAPSVGATDVATGANLVVVFNEPVARGSGDIVLKNAAGSVVESFAGSVGDRLTVVGNTLTVDPTANLVAGTAYTLELGAGAVVDLAGNAFSGSTNYKFSTGASGITQSGGVSGDALAGGAGHDALFGLAGNDTLVGAGGNDSLDGGTGIDTASYSGPRASYGFSSNGGVVMVGGTNGPEGLDTLVGMERLKFSDINVAMDLGVNQSAGATALLLGGVLGRSALALKKPLVGVVIDLFDQGFSLADLSGALLRLPIWGILANGGADTASNTQIANYLLTTIYGRAPDAATLASTTLALDTEVFPAQGKILAQLVASPENQVQINLVGLLQTGLDYGPGI